MIYRIDPLTDRRWEDLVERHPNSSIFHTAGWLKALQGTYGYEPVAYTRTPPARRELTDGLPCCALSSWVTGKRLVSLPFSDHCDPLVEDANSGATLIEEFCREQTDQPWRYIEIRPRSPYPNLEPCMGSNQTYCFHKVDLHPTAEDLYSRFHSSCVRKKIRRADREKLVYREGNSTNLLRIFYNLHLKTRQRLGVPPQPLAWFRNLTECLGHAMKVRIAFAGEIPTAGMITFQFRKALVVKYSGSDLRFQNLGGMQWLYWKAICEAKALGLQELDLGRSDWTNHGLVTFKDHLGATRFPISYWRYSNTPVRSNPFSMLAGPLAWTIGNMPRSVMTLVGHFLYRHIG
jgi:hypothetical protein